jgi:hypothetical protein
MAVELAQVTQLVAIGRFVLGPVESGLRGCGFVASPDLGEPFKAVGEEPGEDHILWELPLAFRRSDATRAHGVLWWPEAGAIRGAPTVAPDAAGTPHERRARVGWLGAAPVNRDGIFDALPTAPLP